MPGDQREKEEGMGKTRYVESHLRKKGLEIEANKYQVGEPTTRCKRQYREMDQKVKRMARADKRTFLNDLASEAEEAAGKGEHGRVYKITKMICCKFCGTSDVPIKDKEGKLLIIEREQKAH